MPRCPTCSREYADPEAACPDCGEAEAAAPCVRCGEAFAAGDACPACGLLRVEVSCDVHPNTPAEGRCVVCGGAVCRACRRGDGRATLCAEHASVVVIQGWAQIYSTQREFEAQLVRDNLVAEGVAARIFSQKDNMLSVALGDLSIVRLLVPAWEYEPAKALIRGYMDAEGEVAFACPACGESYEAGADACSACGAPRPGAGD